MNKVAIASIANVGHMADMPDWLAALLKYLGIGGSNGTDRPPKGSVPIPGTLLLFGGGFVGLMVWRAIRT
jgi:hypothetical protein